MKRFLRIASSEKWNKALGLARMPCPGMPGLELVSRAQFLGAGKRRGEGEKSGKQPGAALIAEGQPAVAGQPGQRAFDDPVVAAQPSAGVHAAWFHYRWERRP